MAQTRIDNKDIKKPLTEENITLASGIDLLPAVNSQSDLGSTSYKFGTIYADSFVGSLSGSFVRTSGDTMTGALTMGSGINILAAVSGLGNIGAPTVPFNNIFANALTVGSLSIGGSGIDTRFVNVTGDSMSGDLSFSQTNATISGVTNLAIKAAHVSTTATGTITFYPGSSFIMDAGSDASITAAGGDIDIQTTSTSPRKDINLDATSDITMLARDGIRIETTSGGTGSRDIDIYTAAGRINMEAYSADINIETQVFPGTPPTDGGGHINLKTVSASKNITLTSTGYISLKNAGAATVKFSGSKMVLDGAVDIINTNSGINNIGSAAKPFSNIYANNIIGPSGSGAYLSIAGGQMDGPINFADGVGITFDGVGTSDIGEASYPVGQIYAGTGNFHAISGLSPIQVLSNMDATGYTITADNIIANSISMTGAGAFVHVTGDTMTGDLNFSGAAGIADINKLTITSSGLDIVNTPTATPLVQLSEANISLNGYNQANATSVARLNASDTNLSLLLYDAAINTSYNVFSASPSNLVLSLLDAVNMSSYNVFNASPSNLGLYLWDAGNASPYYVFSASNTNLSLSLLDTGTNTTYSSFSASKALVQMSMFDSVQGNWGTYSHTPVGIGFSLLNTGTNTAWNPINATETAADLSGFTEGYGNFTRLYLSNSQISMQGFADGNPYTVFESNATSVSAGRGNTLSGAGSSTFGHGNTALGSGTQVFGKNVTGTIANTLYLGAPSGVMIQSGKNLLPETNSTQDLGSPALHWGTIYADNIVSTGSTGDYVNVTGDTMTGLLTISNGGLTVQNSSITVSSGASIVSVGVSNIANANNSSAFGSNNQVGQAGFGQATALGNYNHANASYATAVGYINLVSGDSATAVGHANTVNGSNALGIGYSNTSAGAYSSSVGFDNDASANYSSAIGNGNISAGANSSAFGYSNEIAPGGSYSSAFGYNNNISGDNASSLGNANNAIGIYSTAVGASNTASALRSAAIGYSNTASGVNSSAFGWTNSALGPQSTAVGYNNVASGTGTIVVGKNVTGTLDETLYLGAPSGVVIQEGKSLFLGSGSYIQLVSSGNIAWKIRVTDAGVLETFV